MTDVNTECQDNWTKFVTDLTKWLMLDTLTKKDPAPLLIDYKFCRMCALSMYSRLHEVVSVHGQDVMAIVRHTQDQIDEIEDAQEAKKAPALKH